MPKFHLINHYYAQTSQYLKYFLYAIAFIFSLLIIYNIEDEKQELAVKNKIKVFESKINEVKKLSNKKINLLTVMQELESYAKSHGLIINKIHQKKEFIELSFIAPFDKTLFFIDFCEQFNAYSKIESLIMNSSYPRGVHTKIKLSFKHFYLKKKQKRKKNVLKKSQNKELKLTAIVGKYALINNHWIEKNQSILDFKLLKIHENTVELKQEKKTLTLELYDASQ